MWPPPLVFVLPRDWETLDFSFRFLSFFFLFGFILFSGLGGWGRRGGSCWNRAVGLSLSLPTPGHGRSRGTRLGSRFWFPPHPSAPPAAQDPRSRGNLEAKILVGSRRCRPAGSRLGNLAGEASPWGCAQPGNVALALPGAVPEGQAGESPEEPSLAPLRSVFSCCFRSECQPLWMNQSRVPGGTKACSSPTDAAHAPGTARRPSPLGGPNARSFSSSISVLIGNVWSFIFWSYLDESGNPLWNV